MVRDFRRGFVEHWSDAITTEDRWTMRVAGPLAPYGAGFAGKLDTQGYRSVRIRQQMTLMAHLSRWIAEQGLDPGGLTAEAVAQFAEVMRTTRSYLMSERALRPLSEGSGSTPMDPAVRALRTSRRPGTLIAGERATR